MVQGTTSHSGKTLLVAAFCRLFSKSGYRVAPFKAQNMSLNSVVTEDDLEISRAQALQALAAGIKATADMNPILLKPKGSKMCQVIVRGKPKFDLSYKDYMTEFAAKEGFEIVRNSYDHLSSNYDIVVIEGAGSPAEINLSHDIANMRVAEMAHAPVILAADIDRGGVFASLVGTICLLKKKEREFVKGLIINMLRGDPELLEEGIKTVQRLTGKKVLGVMPYIKDLSLPQEDSLSLEGHQPSGRGRFDIAVIRLPHISNFTDFDPLCAIQGVRLRYIFFKEESGTPDLLIIPGTKNTISDLEWLRDRGFLDEISRIASLGIPLIGICGGYQMLGKTIIDKKHIEGDSPTVLKGLGLLDISTEFDRYAKTTRNVSAIAVGGGPILEQAKGQAMDGYEIHMGRTLLGSDAKPAFAVFASGDQNEMLDGATNSSGLVLGTYLHGIFDGPPLRDALLKYLATKKGLRLPMRSSRSMSKGWIVNIDRVVSVMKRNLDISEVYKITGLRIRDVHKQGR